nr:14977_t:CDS:2 [Entrophospora candida]
MEFLNDVFMRMMTDRDFSLRKSREDVAAEFEEYLKKLESQFTAYPTDHYHTFTTLASNNQNYRETSHNVNLHLANRISIANLELDKVHTNKFLLCRVITRCCKMASLMTIVEDPEGDAVKIALYNWVKQSDIPLKYRNKLFPVDKVSMLLPIGTKIAIKNPYYKIATDGTPMIRSDNPGEIIIIDQNKKLFNGVKCGNDYFKSGNFASAIGEYSNGISLEPSDVTLLCNRAEAYLKLNKYAKALADVEVALNYQKDNKKAIFRKARALFGLKRYQEAVIILQDLLQKSQDNTDDDTTSTKKSVEQLLKRAEMFDSENRNGQYDYIRIVDEFCERVKVSESNEDSTDWVYEGGPRLDHADFLTDNIEIRSVNNKGRGWFAKCKIPEGTLLMASKAFGVVYVNEAPPSLNLDFSNKIMKEATEIQLITNIAQKLNTEPDFCKEVYKLYAGPGLVPGKKLSKGASHSVDINRIEKILQYNSFGLRDHWHVFDNIGKKSDFKSRVGTGLWILPSYFNHTCVDINVDWFVIGDLMFLRSCQPILKGEELVLSYCNPMSSYEERSSYLKFYDINCECRLCKLERTEDYLKKQQRDNILENYEKSVRDRVVRFLEGISFDISLVKDLKNIIDKLDNLRKEHTELDFYSVGPKSALAMEL